MPRLGVLHSTLIYLELCMRKRGDNQSLQVLTEEETLVGNVHFRTQLKEQFFSQLPEENKLSRSAAGLTSLPFRKRYQGYYRLY